MGVLNVTPDSFSDGGALHEEGALSLDLCLRRARRMLADGADILDIGGESTRPGAAPVPLQEEMDRVLPVVEALAAELAPRISVDTSSPELMAEAMARGAWMINDVRALRRPGAVAVAAASGARVCLMHMQGAPDTMQLAPEYEDVVEETGAFLLERAQICMDAGVPRNKIWLDPGFGFGKTLRHNLDLLAGLPRLCELGFPLLVGLSRKSMIDKIAGCAVEDRLPGSLALAVLAADRGAGTIRTHDVAETAAALATVSALHGLSVEAPP